MGVLIGYNVLRVHRGLDGGTDKNWRVEPYSYMFKKPCSYFQALAACAYFADLEKMPGIVMVRNLSQAVHSIPGLQDIEDFSARGARVVINKFLCTIDVYFPVEYWPMKGGGI